jgi:hypothetical protein
LKSIDPLNEYKREERREKDKKEKKKKGKVLHKADYDTEI